MLELYQFEFCLFCEKVRLILDYKGLEYKKVQITPGIGQLEVFNISGQRKLPVLKDGDTVISDSTEIALYLDRKYPEKPIIPVDPVARGQCLLIEEWADESIAVKGRKAFLGAINHYQNFRTSLLPRDIPDVLKNIVGAVPSDFLDILGTGVGLGTDIFKTAENGLKQDLEALSLILQSQSYLVSDTDEPTLADLAVAALSTIIKFPAGNYIDVPVDLQGKGIPGLADNSNYANFFTWRDLIYTSYRQPLSSFNNSNGTGSGDSQPTKIEIE